MVDRNHSDLNSIISSGLADNSSGLITAELLRNIMTDTVDTMFSITQSSGTNFNLSGDTGPGHLVLAQSSGIRIVGGTNVSTALSDSGDGSGTVTISTTGAMNHLMLEASDGASAIKLMDGSGLRIAAGDNITTVLSDAGNGSGVVTISASGAFMSNFKLAAGDEAGVVEIVDSSGIRVAGGDGISVSLESDSGSGVYTIASTAINDLGLGADNIDTFGSLTMQNQSGIKIVGGDNIDVVLSDSDTGSGVFTISTTGVGTRMLLGAQDGLSPIQLENGSGLFFAAGDNVTVSLSNADGGSGVVTISTTGVGTRLMLEASDGREAIQLGEGSGIRIAGGDGILTTLSDADGGSGIITVAHDDTSSQSSVNNSGNTFIQDITLDEFGHITAITSSLAETGNMSSFFAGARDGEIALELANGSGLFFDSGDNVSVVASKSNGSGVITISSTDTVEPAIATGTMSRLMLGAQDGESILQLTDSSGIHFAAGDNISITLNASENNGSGVVTISSAHPTIDNSTSSVFKGTSGIFGNTFIQGVEIDSNGHIINLASGTVELPSGNIFSRYDVADSDSGFSWGVDQVKTSASGDVLKLIAGTNIDLYSDATNKAIKIDANDTVGTGTMSCLKIGASDGLEQLQHLQDGSGIFFAAGDNMTITLTNNDAGSGILTFASSSSGGGDGTATSGNAFTTISAGGDSGYTWTSTTNIVADGDADTLSVVMGSGIRIDTDASSDAIRFSVSGALPLATHPSISAASSSDNDSNTFIQDITLDAYGHITAIGTNTVPSGNYHPIIDSSNRLDATLIGANGNVSNAEFGYLASVSSDIQTQIDAKGSGTMSKFHIGSTTQVDPNQISIGDGSGLFFAAGDNMTITTTNTDGSGVVTFASTASGGSARSVAGDTDNGLITWVTSDNTFAAESNLTYDGTTLKVAGLQGNNPGVPFIESDGIIYGSGISTGASGLRIAGVAVTSTAAELNILDGVTADANELNLLDGVTATTTELNYVDGVTSAIQTQLDAKGSGTMSRLKIGASDGLPQLQQLGDGSGIFFAAGDNVSVTLTNSDAGSGIVTIASAHPSISAASTSDNGGNTFIQDITLDGNGHVTGIGTNTIPSGNYHPVIDASNRLDASLIGANGNVSNTEYGYLASVSSDIQTQLDAKGSGTMSRLKIGASDGLPQLQQLGDGSGIFFAGGDNMTVTLTNNDAGSGILTFAASAGGASDIDGLSDCLVENNSIYLGNDPSSTTSGANYNIALGTTALEDITTGDGNVAIGYNASKDLTTGTYTVAIGYEPNVGATTVQSKMVVIGYQAGESSSSFTNRSSSIIIGDRAGKLSHVQDSVIIGSSAGQYIGDASNTEVNVVAIGSSAMSGNSSDVADSYGSVGIGYRAGKDKGRGTAAHYCIYLGFEAGYADADHASNMLYIANDEPSTTGAGGTIIKADMEEKHLAIGQADLLTNSAGDGTLQIYPYEAADEAIFVKMPTSHSGNLIQIQNSSGSDLFVVDSNGAVEISPYGTSAGNTGEIRLLELAANGTNYVGFKAPDAIGASDSQIYVLPAADGSNGQQLTTDGNGNLSWAASGSGGSGEANEYSFKTISVSGQDDVVADTTTDTLTLAAGSNVTITTTAGTDTITIAATDTNTTYSAATSSALGLVKIEDDTEQSVAANAVSATASRTYGIQLNSSDQAVVNVPWTDTNTNTMGSGFTVSATTDTTATTITEGDDLFFAAGTGITCETTADGTVTISCTVTDTNTMGSGFVLEDGDGTEVTITENKEVKFVEGAGIDIDWTDVDNGTDGDPYDLTFTVSDTTVAGDSGSTGITPGDTLTIAGGTNVTTAMSGDTLTITATDTNTMGSGFTVSATTDSNATTITQGDDLMFAAGTGITCETTADGTVTISCTVSDTNTTYTAGDGLDLGGTEFSVDLKANGGLVIESTEIAVDLAASSITGTLAVGDGGTGATTLTDGGILLGSGTGAVTAMSVLGDGVIVVGDNSTDPTTITAFTASDGVLKHEVGGLELDISAIAIGDVIAGTGTGSVGIVTSTGHNDGDVLTLQADGTADWEAASGGIDGSGAAGYVAIWSDADTLTYDNNQLYWDSSNNELGIGTATPASTLHVAGTVSLQPYTISSSSGEGDTDWDTIGANTKEIGAIAATTYLIETGNTDRTIELPDPASTLVGRTYTIKKTDSGTGKVVIQPYSAGSAPAGGYIDGDNQTTGKGGDTLYCQYDVITATCAEGTTSDQYEWHIVEEKVRAHTARVEQTSAQSINDDVVTQITFDADDFEFGADADHANDKIIIKRAGVYHITGFYAMTNVVGAANYVKAKIGVTPSGGSVTYHAETSARSMDHITAYRYKPATVTSVTLELDVDDEITLYGVHTDGGHENTRSATDNEGRCFLEVKEIR